MYNNKGLFGRLSSFLGRGPKGCGQCDYCRTGHPARCPNEKKDVADPALTLDEELAIAMSRQAEAKAAEAKAKAKAELLAKAREDALRSALAAENHRIQSERHLKQKQAVVDSLSHLFDLDKEAQLKGLIAMAKGETPKPSAQTQNQQGQPQPDDAVLGGQHLAPAGAVVLGGIEGIKMRLASDNLEEKKAAIMQALNYGEQGVEALFRVLEQESNLDVRQLAYKTLKQQNNSIIHERLKSYSIV